MRICHTQISPRNLHLALFPTQPVMVSNPLNVVKNRVACPLNSVHLSFLLFYRTRSRTALFSCTLPGTHTCNPAKKYPKTKDLLLYPHVIQAYLVRYLFFFLGHWTMDDVPDLTTRCAWELNSLNSRSRSNSLNERSLSSQRCTGLGGTVVSHMYI